MEESDIEKVKELIRVQLSPALADAERRMMAAATVLVDDVRAEVRRDHAENRTRFDQNYNMAAKAVAQNEFILENQASTREEVVQVRTLLQDLLRGIGVREGEDKAKAKIDKDRKDDNEKRSKRREAFLKWLIGLLGTGGIVTMAQKLYQHWRGN